MRLSQALDWLGRHRLEAGLTLRMSAAGLISFAVAQWFGMSQAYWAVLTAVFVMQASVGGSLKAMIDRLVDPDAPDGCGAAVGRGQHQRPRLSPLADQPYGPRPAEARAHGRRT